MRIAFTVATAALTLVAAPAFAQDSYNQGAETTADAPFAGVYVGGSFGYDVQPNDQGSRLLFDRNLDGRFGDTVTLPTGANAFSPGFCKGAARSTLSPQNAATGCRNDKNGIAYYARVGADHQVGNIVYGVVGEFGKAEINDSVSGFSTTPANYVMTRELDWEASIRGRVGYAVDTTLFYGTFGPGYARIDRSFTTSNTANAFALSGDRNQFGFLGGGGIEQKLGRNFSVGLEYMYHQYQDDDARVRVTQGTAPATNPFVLAPNTSGTDIRRSDDKFRWHSIRATAAFRF
ncbi:MULTISPECIES: outer membrane beta-barrel protein [Sphingomonas]|uniref:Outer membrane beta-barrel protein n=1 Tax=Sphingomonas carotinifaciens TaxID=1166323 RepID=A0A1G7KJE8_9SPHN|nr:MULTISPECIES: outer membrane beta-barrel protein [Sphingomonas]MBB4085298.1 outer membrane immunogenic protein [Sphingomonas carotinifaciens]MWC43677.1 outer membrane beta-barrel protein [Sphingomonas carotinifaciens]SDF37373.1 outer membrane immunogenic protein [Sphingomonas carotinifaciens]